MDLVFYEGAHSATFGNMNSWTDWHLIPTSKPVISVPSIKVKQVDIPGANGSIDLTNILTGYPLYNNRTGSLDYILAPGFGSFEDTVAEVMMALHGKRMNLYLTDEPNCYYTGVFYVESIKADAKVSGISIKYELSPFKYSNNTSHFTVNNTYYYFIDDCLESTPVYITSTANMVLAHGYYDNSGDYIEESYTITGGQNNAEVFSTKQGHNILRFTGVGGIILSYRGTRL